MNISLLSSQPSGATHDCKRINGVVDGSRRVPIISGTLCSVPVGNLDCFSGTIAYTCEFCRLQLLR